MPRVAFSFLLGFSCLLHYVILFAREGWGRRGGRGLSAGSPMGYNEGGAEILAGEGGGRNVSFCDKFIKKKARVKGWGG